MSDLSQRPKATGQNRDNRYVDDQPDERQPLLAQPAIVNDSNTTTLPSTPELQCWNFPRINIFRFFVTNLSMFIMGMNDGCIGALIPYIQSHYSVNYTTVATLFALPVLGYLIAALSNNWLHYTFGQRGIAFFGPLFRLIGYVPMALHPPFPVLPCVLIFAGLGNGVEDSAYNAWVGHMYRSNELLGLLHGSYGLGATISPLISTAMIVKEGLPWYTFFYVMIGLVVVEFLVGVVAFWDATSAEHRKRFPIDQGDDDHTSTRAVLKKPITWLVSVFLIGYVGAEVSLGGWIVTFMLRVRHATPFMAGLTVTLFWLGITLGRVVLGFITERVGEKLAITIYLGLSIGLEVLYWLVPNFVASAIFVTLLGFFLGPLFPASIVAMTKLLPVKSHISAIGFAASFGSGGAAVLPFVVGLIAESKGVEVLQPIVLAIFVFIMLVWLMLPGGFRKSGLERARKEDEAPGDDVKKAWEWIKTQFAS